MLSKFYNILFLFLSLNVLVIGQIYVGAAWYPENSTPEVIETDVRLMREADFNLVRLGDFAWYALEPEGGKYNFSWLDKAISKLSKEQIEVLLCTPTAAIPKWLYDAHPEIMQLQENGERKPYGRRRHACLNNDVYREYCLKIARALANQYKDNKSVIGFQIDNELATEDPICYCSSCQNKFALWLKTRYKTIDRLNKAWGTTFWSQNMSSFEQVWLPRKMDNPSAYLDFKRFNSEYTIDFFRMQSEAIRKIAPRMKITTNIGGSGFVNTIDLNKLSKFCDVLAFDNYPINVTLENNYGNNTGQPFDPAMTSFALQQIRGGRRESIWVTEEQIGKTALVQREIVSQGMVRLWTHQQLAYGCNMSLFFPFRAFESAHEHLMSGVVESDGVKRSKYMELQKTAKEIRSIYKITGQMIPVAKAALIRDYDADWTFNVGYTFCPDIKHLREMYAYYQALRKQSIMTDVISSSSDLSKYELIVIPYQSITTTDFANKLKDRVQQGATVIITCLTGVRDTTFNKFGAYVHPVIQQLAGIDIEDQFALFASKRNELSFDNMKSTCGLWFDQYNLTTAKSIATYTGNYLKNMPAISRNEFGKGIVYFVGTIPEQTAINRIVKNAISDTKLSPIARSSNSRVDISELISTDGKKHFIYAINFSDTMQEISIERPLKSVINGQTFTQNATIQAGDFGLFEY